LLQIHDEGIKRLDRYQNRPRIDKEYVEKSINYIKKLDQNLPVLTEQFLGMFSVDLRYSVTANNMWATSFWTGMLWLAYEVTGHEKYRQVGEIHLESFRERLENRINIDHHDIGFLYTLSAVAAYKLTKNETAKELALKAANYLIGRFKEKGRFIVAWGELGDRNDPRANRIIMDCLMNLPLLYWATETSGDSKYNQIAREHLEQTIKYLVRRDGSTFHTFVFEFDTDQPLFGKTHQGYADNSCWARGQAWGIYGFPLSYNYTGDWGLIELTKKVTNYFLNRLPEDQICYWDLVFIEGTEERDSSGAAIAVCGLLELAKHLPLSDESHYYYGNAALKILDSLMQNYTTIDHPQSNGILLHAVSTKPGGSGVDECCIWGDYYYYFEALVRLMNDWKLYW
jgi:unsaturated chondroitin disaccharide hydrolase